MSIVSGCIISMFNFINNSDSSGYIKFYFANIRTTIKQSVFSFDSRINSMKWVYNASLGSSVAIESSFVISSETIQDDARVVMSDVERVSSAPTHRQFQQRPHLALCGLKSSSFTGQKDFTPLQSFILSSITMVMLSVS